MDSTKNPPNRNFFDSMRHSVMNYWGVPATTLTTVGAAVGLATCPTALRTGYAVFNDTVSGPVATVDTGQLSEGGQRSRAAEIMASDRRNFENNLEVGLSAGAACAAGAVLARRKTRKNAQESLERK